MKSGLEVGSNPPALIRKGLALTNRDSPASAAGCADVALLDSFFVRAGSTAKPYGRRAQGQQTSPQGLVLGPHEPRRHQRPKWPMVAKGPHGQWREEQRTANTVYYFLGLRPHRQRPEWHNGVTGHLTSFANFTKPCICLVPRGVVNGPLEVPHATTRPARLRPRPDWHMIYVSTVRLDYL